MVDRWISPAFGGSFCMGARMILQDRSDLLSKLIIFSVLLLVFDQIFAIMPLERLNMPQITAERLLWYFVVTEIVTVGTQGLRRDFGRTIAAGQITTLMQRPGSMLLLTMTRLFGSYITQMALLLSFACIVLPPLGLPMPMPWKYMPILLVMLAFGGLITLLLGYMTGMFEIFGPYSQPIDWIVHKFVMALGGLFFPVSLFPPLAQYIVMLTPFPAILFIPGNMMLDSSEAVMLDGILIQIFWLVVLGALAFILEYKLVKRVMRLGD
jgi:ABC-type uncharacterized transport system permease subunit